MRKINTLIPEAISNVCTKKGLINSRIILDWDSIVGTRLAKISFPISTKFLFFQKTDGVLIIGISNPGYALEIQMSERMILDRVAVYFGYKAVTSIRIILSR